MSKKTKTLTAPLQAILDAAPKGKNKGKVFTVNDSDRFKPDTTKYLYTKPTNHE